MQRFNWNHPSEGHRYPRTLQEAFGPYANGSQLFERSEPVHRSDNIIVAVGVVALVAVGIMAAVGWLPGGAV
jgi:hypothetical protein